MDISQARNALNRELETLAQRRRRHLEDADECALQIGATTTYLREVLDQPKSASADVVGLSPSYMSELMTKAVEAGTEIDDPLRRIPVLAADEVSSFVQAHGGLARIVASFADVSDTLYMADLDPVQFLREGRLTRCAMLVLTSDGEWCAPDDVTVGYGGTGPSNAYRALTGLGLDDALARRIAYSRVSDVAFEGGPTAIGTPLHTDEWPHVGLAAPQRHRDRWVVAFGLDGLSAHEGDSETQGGFYPRQDPAPYLQRWLSWLDNAPRWASGPRRARVYLSRNAAIEDGFTGEALTPWNHWSPDHTVFTVILEQGSLQLWLSLPRSTDPTIQFAPETYEVLHAAGFYVDDLEADDSRHAFWRWLATLGKTRPPYVDLADPIRTAT